MKYQCTILIASLAYVLYNNRNPVFHNRQDNALLYLDILRISLLVITLYVTHSLGFIFEDLIYSLLKIFVTNKR